MTNILQAIVTSLGRKAGVTRPARHRRQRPDASPFKRTLLAESLEQRVLLAADPLSVARVSGSVDSAGEVDHFTFHLDAAARLSFDSLTENGNLRWNLSGPAGAVVSNAYFRALSSTDGNYAPLDLGPGDYRVDVSGAGDTTGAYDMRLLDLARATPIAADTPVTGTFDASGQTVAFTFDGQAGEKLFLTWAQHPDSYFRMYDPAGQLLGNQYYYDTQLPTLTYSGRYTVLLDGSNGVPANAAYAFTLHQLVAPVVDSGLWTGATLPVTGTVVAAGDVAIYRFSVASARSVILDSLTWNDSLTLSLSGPQGQVYDSFGTGLTDRPLGNYLDRGFYSAGRVDLVAGNYTLVIRGNNTAVGDFSLRLLDIAAASFITPGSVVSGQLNPGNVAQVYAFDAVAGDNIDVHPIAADTGSPSLMLLDPFGRRVGTTWNFYDLPNLTLSLTGRYTLVVSGENFRTDPDNYSFKLIFNSNTPQPGLPVGTPLVLGSTQTFSLPAGGGSTVFNFTLAHDTTVYFDPQSTTPNYDSYWSLSGPHGAELADTYLGWYYGFEGARVLNLVAGDYAITFRSSQQADNFAFRLLDLGAAAAPSALGSTVSGTLNPGSGAAAYGFEATAGQRAYLQALSTSNGNLRWRLLDAFGREVVGYSGWNDWEGTLTIGGHYTLLVEGFNALGATPVNYSFSFGTPVDLSATYDPAVVATASPQWTNDNAQAAVLLDGHHDIKVGANPALNLTQDVSFQVRFRADAFDQTWQSVVYKGANTSDGQSRTYSLWLNANGYLLLSTSDAYGEMGVGTVAGTVLLGQWYDVTGVIDRSTGLLKIFVDGVEAASGTLRTFAGGARVQDSPLYLGSSHEGWYNSNSEFAGAISEFRLWDQALNVAGVQSYLTSAPSAADTHLKAWLKLDEASGTSVADASLSHLSGQIHNRFEGMTGVVAGRISQPGQQSVYHLSLPQAGLFYLDSLSSVSEPNGYYPHNLIINGPGVAFNENLSYFGNRVISLRAGDYTFTVDGNGRNVGEYAFRLINLAGAQQFAYGAAVSGDLRPGDTAQLYQFDATAGDAVYFQNLGASGFNPAWRLVDPFGREVFGRTGLGDRDTSALAYSGKYTLIVDGDYTNYDQTSHFGFKLRNVTPTVVQTLDIAAGLDVGAQRQTGADAGSVQISDAQYLEFANTPATDQTGSYTLETRFRIDRPSSNSWVPLIIKSSVAGQYQVGIFVNNDGRIQVGAQPSGGAGYNYIESAGGLATAGVWHQLAAVYDRANSQIRIVLDGVQVAVGYLNPVAGIDLADALRIGRNNDGNNYTGGQVSIDRLAIWNKALSAIEVAAFEAAPVVGNDASLVALYNLDEASGTALTDALGGTAGAIQRLAGLTTGLVTGRISELGQTQHYRFTLTEPRSLYFDSLTRRYDLRWSLTGPTVSTGDTFYSGDSNNGRNLLTLVAGTYDITVDGDGAATGDYMFRFVNAGAAPVVALDTVVNGRIDPGLVSTIYRFNASAGQQVFLDMLSFTGSTPVMRLLDPTGAQVFGLTSFADRDTLTLARTGLYTLIIEDYTSSGSASPARDFSFKLRTVSDVTKSITLGTSQLRDPIWTAGPVAGETAVSFDGSNQLLSNPSAALDLTGDVTLEAMVRVDAFGYYWTPIINRASDWNHQTFGLYVGAAGQVNLDSNWEGNGWAVGSAAGVVQLGQWNRISATIDRTHALARIYVNGVQVLVQAIDGRAAASLPTARLHVGSSDLTNGDRAELYGAVSDVRVWRGVRSAAEIDAAKGLTMAGTEAGLMLNLALNEGTGRTLTDTSVNAIVVRNADLFGDLGPTLVEGAITQIGSRVIYNLSSASDKRILFDSLTPDSRFTWSLLGPDGAAVVNSRTIRDSDAYSRVMFNLKAGLSYTLVVDANGDVTGNYAFRLLDFAGATTIAYDTPTTWSPDQARSTALYSFNGVAGDQIVFDRINYTDTRPVVHIFDPSGAEIYGPADFYYDSGVLTLTVSGRYTVALEGQIDSRGHQDQSFQIQLAAHNDVVPPATTQVSFVGGVIAIATSLTNTADTLRYSFHLDAATTIYVDTLNHYPAYYTAWVLTGPNGTVANRWGYDTDGINQYSGYALVAGDYVFSIYEPNPGYTFALGPVAYNLIDMGQAQAISLGDSVTGALTPANSAKFYSFDAVAGDRVFAAVTAQSNMGNAYWRLIDLATGAVVGANYFGNNLDGVLLSHSGRYLLTVEGYYDTGGDASYGFTLGKTTDTTQALTLGSLVAGTLVNPGDTQRYSFTLTAASQLWFDSVGRRDGLVWRVLDADGVSIFGDRNYADYAWLNNTRIDLGAGQYTLVIDGTNAAVGNFGFRLLDLAAATLVAPGTAVSGQLAPADKTLLYRFNGIAGDRYFFDVLSRSGGNTYWRLLDPYGNYLFWNEGMNDHGTTALPYTGTYTLAIEGYPDDPLYYAANVSFSFNITPVVDQAAVPLAIGVLPGPNLQVHDLAVAGGDGSVHSGGSLLVSWNTANVGDRPSAASFQERVIVKNAGGETLVNQLVNYDALLSGAIASGAQRARGTTVQLPAGARGAGTLTVIVITDVVNAVTESGASGENDNTSQMSVESVLLTYPDLTVQNLVLTPATNLAAGDQATVSWRVANSGDRATTGAWSDHVVVRNLSTGEVLLDQVTRVADLQAAVPAGGGLDRQLSFSWPGGRKAVGVFQVTVSTDSLGDVAEYNAADTGEINNSATLQITSAPDLQVSDLQVLNPAPVSGDLLNLRWTLTNNGNAATPQGWFDRVQVINDTTGQYLVNVDVAYDPVAANGAALAAGASVQRAFSVRLPDGLRGTGNLRVIVSVDQNAAGASLIPESNENNNDATVNQAVTLKPYPNLAVSNVVAPNAQRSGDAMPLAWTVTNVGTLATTASAWVDRVILSVDAVIGNGDDIVLTSLTHNGALAAGASYTINSSFIVPGGLDGNYHLAVVTDAFSADLEPDNRADNTSALSSLLFTAYHADLLPSFTAVPASALGGTPMTVSWHVDNNGDAATNGGFWYDQLWLSADGTLGAGAISLGYFAHSGALGVGQGYDVTQQISMPNGLAGTYKLVLRTDAFNYVFESRFRANDTVVSAAGVVITAAPAVDLRVQAVTGPARVQPGQVVTVQWDVTNTGVGAAAQPWTDQVYVSRDGTLSGAYYLGSLTHGAALGAGASYHASLDVGVPDLADGNWRFLVVTDVANQVYETGAADAESANTGAAAAISVAAHPDLHATNLAVGTLVGGQASTLTWNVRNDGGADAPGSWVEKVYLSSDGVLDGSDTFLGQVTVTGGLTAGSLSAQSLNITPPLGAVGAYRILVLSDANNNLREAVSEGNNLAALVVSIAQAPLADLTVSHIVGPASGLAGRDVSLSYDVNNLGNLIASGAWSEQIYLSSDTAIGGDILLANFYEAANSVAAGGSVARSRVVTLPAYAVAGDWHLVVRVDAANDLVEQDELNNAEIASAALTIGSALALTLNTASIAEQAGAAAVTGTVVRSGSTTSALTVNLSSTLAGLNLPASVVIAAGQSSATFVMGVIDNLVVDGNRDGTIGATAAAYAGSVAALRVLDNDVAMLTMTTANTTVSEGAGAISITLSRNTLVLDALTVNLSNNKVYKLTAPDTVAFAAGQSSITFTVTPVDDTVPEGDRNVDLSAAAAGFVGGGLRLRVLDNDIPTLTLDLSSSVVSEGAGATSVHGTVTRSIVSDNPITVALSGTSGRVNVAKFVTFAAGAATVDFDIGISQNTDADGDHTAQIGAAVPDQFTGAALPGTRIVKSLLITDDDGPTLSLTIDNNVLAESAGAGAAIATLTRNTPTDTALTVLLSSTDTSEATVQTSVVIPVGQRSVSFAVNAVQDNLQDGTQNATLIAAAAGFNSGSVSLQVTDRDLADLQVSNVSAPAVGSTGKTITLAWTTVNAGLGDVNGNWQDNVYLSTDSTLSPDDQLISTFQNTGPLGQQVTLTRSMDIALGLRAGDLWAFVMTDAGKTITELNEGNNVRAVKITVAPSYYATVTTVTEVAPAGTPIEMTGTAFDVDTNLPLKAVKVTVKVSTAGITRNIEALTDKNGNFKAKFTPLATEAGHYTIAAVYPGLTDNTPQDSFDLIGMQATNGISASLIPGQTVTGTLIVQNLSPIALHNVTASLATLPPGITLSFGAPATLAGSTTLSIAYTLSADASAVALNGNASIRIASDEGVATFAALSLSVNPLVPQLVANPGFLISGMLRGAQKTVSFDITNTGGAGTGPLQVQMPAGVDWLSLSSAATIANLAPGQTATVSLLLSPGADLALQRYDGTVNVVGRNSYVTMPFQFKAVSDATGDVQVTVTDEYTFFAADKPNLAGATVQLLDPYSYAVVATAVTNATGVINFARVAEGPYTLQISAPQHDSFRATVHVTPGTLTSQEAFLHRQAVSYTWTVVPTEITDHYKIVLESTFETEVPMPVVTVDEPFRMPLIIPGYATTFNLTLRNHGLINAERVSIQVPNDPDYIITPLIREIPTLAAKSEVTIPCTIQLSAAGLAKAHTSQSRLATAGPGSTLIKCLGLSAQYTYVCRNNQWVQVPIQIAPAVGCAEGLKDLAKSIPEFLASGGAANLLGAGCDLISAVLDCLESSTGTGTLSDCETALLTTACKAAAGALAGAAAGGVGALPGAAVGALSNWADILACLCSLGAPSLGGTGGGGPGGGGGGGWGFGSYAGGPGSPWSVPIGYNTSQVGCGPTTGSSSSTAGRLGTAASTGVCAEVRLRIEQQAVITRTAFQGTLELNNGRSDTALTDVTLTLDIRDANGNDANGKFVVRGPTTANLTVDANGHWTIPASTVGKIYYTFVPTNEAAPDIATVYSMGGTLHYNEGGTIIDVPLLPARITVYPEAKLNLDYFWQRDIVGDDPFTDQVEPSEAFALGLQVVNIGKGGAANLSISSAQPEIVENEKGLLVNFKIIGSQVGAHAGSNSLTVDLGNIAPGATITAQWNLLSSLQGKFKNFSASFEHLDDNGDLRTSLINTVKIHELTRSLMVSTPSDDHIPDYLVNDVPDDGNLPDTLYLSTGGQAPVTQAAGVVVGGGAFSRTVTASMQAGWSYLVAPDPLPGYELVSVTRSDGKVLAIGGMVWRTDRTWKAGEPGATLENLVKLLDFDSTGSYTFKYAVVDHVAPTLLGITGIAAGVQTTAVDSVDLTFSEPIDEATLTAADLHLRLNGADVAVPAGFTLAWVSGNTWRVSGLASATAADGNYSLSVNAGGVTDLSGNAGTNSASIDWAMGATAPVVLSLQAPTPGLRNTPVGTLELVFSRDMNAASIDWTDLQLSRDGSPVALSAAVGVTAVDARHFTISGLDAFTGSAGAYVLTVRAAGTTDSASVAGLGQASRSWTMDTTAPAPVSLEEISTNPRNIVITSLDVVMSEAIDATSFDWHDVTLTKDGAALNLITSEVTVTQIDATTWRIANFNWKVGQDGTYTLSVAGAGLRDLAGNAGTGSVAESWVMDIIRPQVPSNVTMTPDTGVSSTDGLTNTLAVTLAGDLPETGLRVRITDVTTDRELGLATVTGTHFTGSFTLNSPGQHQLRLRVADAAGNLATDTFFDVYIDMVAPGVSAVVAPTPSPRTTAVDAIDFAFDEAVAPATVDLSDLTLTRDGVAVLFDAGVTLAQLSATQWRVSGLGGLTAAAGAYALSVSAVGVTDRAGNGGLGDKTASWTTQASLPTAISGRVYEDLDGSGSYNPASFNPETGIAGRTVYLDANSNNQFDAGEVSTLTLSDGRYLFDSLAAGSYQVRENLPTHWLQTAPTTGGYDVNLVVGHTVSGADFGNFLAAHIDGVKFSDLNNNGTRDAGEAALAGWTIFLDANANGVLDAGEARMVTGADGAFSFNDLGPSTVQVAEVAQAGWRRSTPAAPVRLRSGMAVTADLGNVQLGSISGMKFNDLNGNGLRDTGDGGVQGWTIFLDANTNGVLDGAEVSTLTDALGNYRFADLLPGSYVVSEVQRDGWVQTKPLPNAVSVGVTTANSSIKLETDHADHADEGTWANYTGSAVIDYGKLAMDSALQSTAITSLRQQAGYSTLDGRGTTTVVIDTGIDVNHTFFGPDLNGNGVDDRIVYQWDFANNDADASDWNGHGSNVSSIIGSQDSVYSGVASATNLISLKVFEDTGRGTFAYLEKALQWVLANRETFHINVVNLSLGDNGNWTDDFARYGIGDELAALAQTDVIVIAAAGNNYLQFGKMGVAYPASDPAAIAVGATWAANFGGPWTVSTGATNYATGADQIAAFSQRSTDLIDTFAPGARFNGANANGGITTMQGTSQAAAFVSGAAALAQQIAHQTLGRGLSTGEFARLLRTTGDAIVDGDDEIDNVVNTGATFGRLNMVKLAAAIAQLGQTAVTDPGAGSGNGSGSTPVAQQAAAGVHNVVLAAGDTVTGAEFGNFQLGSVTGSVFADTNTNGSRDSGEAALDGVRVYIDANGNASFDAEERTTLTAADGSYGFVNLQPGATAIRVQLSNSQLAVPAVQSFIVTSGLVATGRDFAVSSVSVNHAPVAVDDSYAVHAGQVLMVDAAHGMLANDTDADSDTLTVRSVNTAGLQGTLAQSANGGFSFTPTAGFSGDTSFGVVVSDGTATATSTVTIHVTNAVPVAHDDHYSTHAGVALTIAAPGVLGNDTDADGDALHLTSVDAAGLQGVLAELADGSFHFTPTAGFVGQTSFVVHLTDGNGGNASSTVMIDVGNSAPVARADDYSVHAGTVLTIAASGVLGNDIDADGDTLTVMSVDAAGLHGTLSQFANGSFSFTASAGFIGDTSYSYRVSDGMANGQATVTIHVTDAAPVLDAISDQVVNEGSTLTLDLHASDADDSSLSFSLLDAPAGAQLDAHTGHLSWTAGDQDAAQTFRVQVADPSGLTAIRQFSVQVQLGKLVVTSFASADWGFAVRFNDSVDTAALNLYGSSTPDVTVTGTVSGAVRGSVVMDDDGRGFSFIRTGAQLAADRYTVAIRGAADGVVNARRGALDGDANGAAGGNYATSFTLAAPPSVRLRLPDFARGPGQAANVPAQGAGLPVTLASDGTVREIRLRLRADTDTLTVTEVRRGADLPADATLSVTPVAGAAGQFDIVITRATPLPVSAALKLLAIIGSVPTTATLGDAGIVLLENVSINGAASPLAGDAAVDLVGYPGDADFDGRYTATDVTLVGRIGTGLQTGLAINARIDAQVIADIDGNGQVNALDTAQVLARSRANSTAMIPVVPLILVAPVAVPASLPTLVVQAVASSTPQSATPSSPSAASSPSVNLAGSFSNFSLSSTATVLPAASLSILPSVSSAGALA